jgi:hypothetical protein
MSGLRITEMQDISYRLFEEARKIRGLDPEEPGMPLEDWIIVEILDAARSRIDKVITHAINREALRAEAIQMAEQRRARERQEE